MRKNKLKKNTGFTIIEMLVVLAIFGVISSIILFNYSGFNTNISLQNLAQQVALQLRQAQVYALGTHTLPGKGIPNGYGIRFDMTDPKSFITFGDIASSGTADHYCAGNSRTSGPSSNNCTSADTTEYTDKISISSADKIDQICIDPNNTSGPGCVTLNSGTLVSGAKFSAVNIVFNRPNPDAHITLEGSSYSTTISEVVIKILSAQGASKDITVWSTGQITVQQGITGASSGGSGVAS